MTLLEKINKLNDLCEGTLSMTSYTEWVIYSYGEDTVLSYDKVPDSVHDSSLERCIDKALKIAKEAKK